MMNNNVPNWTDDQKEAINHRKGGAIVTANAGAGKTAVVTTRIVDMICDKENPIDPSKLAIITFTKKAAAELKTRINRKLREKLAENPLNAEFIRRQSVLVHNARISTISAFCFSIIREHINLSSLASGFEIMEESRTAMMRYAIAETAVEEFYRTADKKDIDLILEHFVHKDDKALIEAIISISNYATNLTDPDGWYQRCKDSSRFKDMQDEVSAVFKESESVLKNAFAVLDTHLDALAALPEKKQETKKNKNAKECMQTVQALCKDLISYLNDGLPATDISQVTIPDNNSITTDIPSYAKTNVGDDHSANLTVIVQALRDLNTAKTVQCNLYKSQPVIDILVGIAERFEELYAAEKSALNVADYSDAERQLYNMLKKNPDLREKIGLQLIIVDEFQDSNRLQYEIFEMLSDNKENLYFVGDIKQSIYSFRGAQSEVFDEVMKNPAYTCFSLNHNFRSRGNVINGINDIFDAIMTEKLGGVNYKETSRLILFDISNTSDKEEDMTEVLVVCDAQQDAEAAYVAKRINKMIESGYEIEGRPCKAEDFTVILRSDSSKAPIYAEKLAKYDIRSTTKKGGDFLSQPEIQIMLDYLKVIDDPYNDECLARLLMSGLVGFSADKMAAIRTCTAGFDIAAISDSCEEELKSYAGYWRKKPLYSCIKAAVSGYRIDEERYPEMHKLYEENPSLFGSMTDAGCADFEAQLDRLRGVMAASSPAELIKHIYDTTSAADLLTVGENGESRRANLTALLTIACDYTKYHSDGILSDLLSHIDETDRRGLKTETSQEKTAAGVQIMSIHASKGLEFPIVFICDCAKSFNKDDASKNVIMDREYGISICDVNKSLMAKIPSPSYKKTAESIIEKLRDEEMRLLYVAATRAKHKLIFTGKPSRQGKSQQEEVPKKIPCKESSASLITKDSYLSWLLVPYAKYLEHPAMDENISEERQKVGNILYQAVSVYDDPDENDADTDIAPVSDQDSKDIETDTTRLIAKQITSEYAYASSTKVAAKYTATGLATIKRSDNGEKCELYVSRPEFLREADTKKLTGKRKGDAYHKLMEHIPFDKAYTDQQVQDYIKNCTDDFLSDAERECIKPSDISRFFANDIAMRMLALPADKVYREHPIFHRLSNEILSEVIEDYDINTADNPYVQGIVDMFFIEDNGIVLIDYKTDSFSDEEKLYDDYSFQLKVYAEALHKAFSLPVKEMYIYSFKKGKMIKI